MVQLLLTVFHMSLALACLMMNESINQKPELNLTYGVLFLKVVKQGIDSMMP